MSTSMSSSGGSFWKFATVIIIVAIISSLIGRSGCGDWASNKAKEGWSWICSKTTSSTTEAQTQPANNATAHPTYIFGNGSDDVLKILWSAMEAIKADVERLEKGNRLQQVEAQLLGEARSLLISVREELLCSPINNMLVRTRLDACIAKFVEADNSQSATNLRLMKEELMTRLGVPGFNSNGYNPGNQQPAPSSK